MLFIRIIALFLCVYPTQSKRRFGLKMTVPSIGDSSGKFDGIVVDGVGKEIDISNDMFVGKCRTMLRADPEEDGSYNFDSDAGGGGMKVLWEVRWIEQKQNQLICT